MDMRLFASLYCFPSLEQDGRGVEQTILVALFDLVMNLAWSRLRVGRLDSFDHACSTITAAAVRQWGNQHYHN